jgi:hypothetical protein
LTKEDSNFRKETWLLEVGGGANLSGAWVVGRLDDVLVEPTVRGDSSANVSIVEGSPGKIVRSGVVIDGIYELKDGKNARIAWVWI